MAVKRILRIREVCEAIGLSKPTVYRMIGEGSFPAPVKLGARAVGWHLTVIDEWLQARPPAEAGS